MTAFGIETTSPGLMIPWEVVFCIFAMRVTGKNREALSGLHSKEHRNILDRCVAENRLTARIFPAVV